MTITPRTCSRVDMIQALHLVGLHCRHCCIYVESNIYCSGLHQRHSQAQHKSYHLLHPFQHVFQRFSFFRSPRCVCLQLRTSRCVLYRPVINPQWSPQRKTECLSCNLDTNRHRSEEEFRRLQQQRQVCHTFCFPRRSRLQLSDEDLRNCNRRGRRLTPSERHGNRAKRQRSHAGFSQRLSFAQVQTVQHTWGGSSGLCPVRWRYRDRKLSWRSSVQDRMYMSEGSFPCNFIDSSRRS